ncbi:unnamed protein product [Blepharisma stoltei]|uniref:Reverse transcriptase n=1 Tax=Blepharisma stoltei TaxID=1481888 RepID=A0AAU9I9X5_9CILI|nr:unnamed protein product [Blepharisma stoltei]
MLDICDGWAEKFSVAINPNNSETMHMPDSSRRQALVINEVPLKTSKNFRYLGYIVQTRRNGTGGLNSSTAKTRASCMAQFDMLASLRDVSIERKATILKACLTTVSVYAKECGSENMPSMSKSKWDRMERIQRRIARWLLEAPNGTANEAALIELRWISICGRIAVRTLNFRLRCQRSNNWLTKALMLLNVEESLDWQIRYLDQLRGYSIEDCLCNQRSSDDKQLRSEVQSKIRTTEYTNNLGSYRRKRRQPSYAPICSKAIWRWKDRYIFA